MNKGLYYFLQLTWGCIQNLIGLVMMLVAKCMYHQSITRFENAFVIKWKHNHHAMSMGMFLFVEDEDDEILVHEYGHSIQSAILGPFYLLIIGLPSFIWANHPHYIHKRKNKKVLYSSFYPERWANHCGLKATGRKGIQH